MGDPKMSTVEEKLQRDLEKGGEMDPSPGERKDKALRSKDEKGVISYLFKLLKHFGVHKFCTEQASPENQWQETKKMWIVAGVLLSCNNGIINSMSRADGSLAQAALILATLAFVLNLILVITPIAMPTLHMPNVKRFVLVSAVIVTACSYLCYVPNKMGPITRTSIAAIFFSGLFVSLITIRFLIQLILGAPPRTLPLHSEPGMAAGPNTGYCHSSPASAPPTSERIA